MKSWKWKILLPVVFITIILATKFILWDFPTSSGKRVGNLVKISKKGKFYFTRTWEGTIDEGSGDKLTSYFSVRSNELGEELYNYEGKEVILYYEQYMVGWPWDTTYNVTAWKPKGGDELKMATSTDVSDLLLDKVSSTLFCSLLGTLYADQELYGKVKEYVKTNNVYLHKQFKTCNN